MIEALVSGANFNSGLFETVIKKMSLIQRKTALKILKKYNKPKPIKVDFTQQTEEAIENKWKVMYEVERSRLKDKLKKKKEIIFELNTQIGRLNVELQ